MLLCQIYVAKFVFYNRSKNIYPITLETFERDLSQILYNSVKILNNYFINTMLLHAHAFL